MGVLFGAEPAAGVPVDRTFDPLGQRRARPGVGPARPAAR